MLVTLFRIRTTKCSCASSCGKAVNLGKREGGIQKEEVQVKSAEETVNHLQGLLSSEPQNGQTTFVQKYIQGERVKFGVDPHSHTENKTAQTLTHWKISFRRRLGIGFAHYSRVKTLKSIASVL